MVIVMHPARALSADVGSKIFGSSKDGLTYIGIKLDGNTLAKSTDKDLNFPLVTLWNKQKCHWPINNAKAAFGFNEVI